MTQAQRSTTQARYHGEVYGVDLLDHDSVMAGTPKIVPNDYVGKTRQRGRKRENQHRDDQPWSDLIVGSPRVLWEGICTEDELDRMERRFIRDPETRPRMNWQMNEDNPCQVPKWVQLEQRHTRDDAAGRPRWVPPKERPGYVEGPRVPQPRRTPAMPVRRWEPWQVKSALWSSAWVLTAGLWWLLLARWGWPAGGWREASAGMGAALLLWWSVVRWSPGWKRGRRRVRRWLR